MTHCPIWRDVLDPLVMIPPPIMAHEFHDQIVFAYVWQVLRVHKLTGSLENKGQDVSSDKNLGHPFDRHIAQVFAMEESDNSSKHHIYRGCVENGREEDEKGLHGIEGGGGNMEMRDSAGYIANDFDCVKVSRVFGLQVLIFKEMGFLTYAANDERIEVFRMPSYSLVEVASSRKSEQGSEQHRTHQVRCILVELVVRARSHGFRVSHEINRLLQTKRGTGIGSKTFAGDFVQGI